MNVKKTKKLDYFRINELMADFYARLLSIFAEVSILHMLCFCNGKKEKMKEK